MVKREVKRVQYMVDRINRHPNFHVPRVRIGILIIKIHVPVGTFSTLFNIMATPETPPGARELGARNRLIATE